MIYADYAGDRCQISSGQIGRSITEEIGRSRTVHIYIHPDGILSRIDAHRSLSDKDEGANITFFQLIGAERLFAGF